MTLRSSVLIKACDTYGKTCREGDITPGYTYLLPTYLPTYLFTYLLTSWSGFLLEKLIGSQLVKKFPAFYETRKLITAITSARYFSLS